MEEENNDFVSRENEDPCFVGPQLQEVEQENDERLSVLSETTVSAYPDFHKPQEEHCYFSTGQDPKIVLSPKSAVYLAVNELNVMKCDNDLLQTENLKLRKGIFEAKKERFSFDHISHDNFLVKFYTGVVTAAIFMYLFDEMKPKLERMQYYKGAKSLQPKSYQMNDYYKPGRARILPLIDEMLLTLMKLRLNLLHEDLAFRFKISNSLVSCILSTWIPFLGFEIGSLIQWPSVAQTHEYYPSCFKSIAGHVISIIDCTEIFTNNPSFAEANSKMYSSSNITN